MRIIELLNKIANGEEVPKYINYIHRALGKDTMFVCSENIINKLDQGAIELNDEVEIIEDTPKEEKKIPKIIPEALFEEYTNGAQVYQLYKTVREITDYLKSKGE